MQGQRGAGSGPCAASGSSALPVRHGMPWQSQAMGFCLTSTSMTAFATSPTPGNNRIVQVPGLHEKTSAVPHFKLASGHRNHVVSDALMPVHFAIVRFGVRRAPTGGRLRGACRAWLQPKPDALPDAVLKKPLFTGFDNDRRVRTGSVLHETTALNQRHHNHRSIRGCNHSRTVRPGL